MDKIMSVYIAKAAHMPLSEASANLALPAMPFELFDALDKARVTQGTELYFEVSDYYAFQYMEPFIADADNLLELNALCQKLSELDDRQSAAFEGLLKMETEKKAGPVSMGRLIDLAYSTDCCHVVSEATSDEALGRFYAENGFIPGVEDLPESTFKLLNFAYIGREMRRGEGGVLTQNGYVAQHTDLAEVYKNMSFTMKTPAYQILLEDAAGNRFELPRQSPLPAGRYTCLDCRIPVLMAAVDRTTTDKANEFAKQLEQMGDKTVWQLKSVLDVVGCDSLEDAGILFEHLEEYMLDPSVSSRAEMAVSEVKFLLGSNDVDLLLKYLDLNGYGLALTQRDHSIITSYGLLERQDHLPMQTPLEHPADYGMEMNP